jgi:predicted Holliday junction resolvase-like endonuclease
LAFFLIFIENVYRLLQSIEQIKQEHQKQNRLQDEENASAEEERQRKTTTKKEEEEEEEKEKEEEGKETVTMLLKDELTKRKIVCYGYVLV